MKKEYNIKDRVWIHLGERKLVEGRVVEIIDLVHLKEGHSPDREFYIVEIKTGIDDVYEVRDFDQISPDAAGPINLFRKNKNDSLKNQRYLKRVGVNLPVNGPDPLLDLIKDIDTDEEFTGDGHDGMGSFADEDDISPDAIHAALEKSKKDVTHTPLNLKAEKPKRRYFKKKPKA
jgi:hypothetical protein